jgi:hypothetical protein
MKKIILPALLCIIVSLTGCDKMKKDFKVNGVKFDFTTESKSGTLAKAPGEVTLRSATQSFTVTRAVDISEMGNDDVVEYAKKINSVVVNNSLIRVTTVPAGTFVVENLTVTAAGVPGSIVIPSYTIGSLFSLTADMNVFTSAFMMKLINSKSVSATVKGNTDAPPGTVINISYESDLLISASVL